jgi:hypothetical protein
MIDHNPQIRHNRHEAKNRQANRESGDPGPKKRQRPYRFPRLGRCEWLNQAVLLVA